MFPDGYTDIAPGKIASVVTYLKMTAPPAPHGRDAFNPSWILRRCVAADLDWYRALFRKIGQDWLWFSRLRMDDDALRAVLHDPAVDLFSLEVDGTDKGILELDRREMPEIEIAFLGVTADLIGQGAGRFLMTRALDIAWSHNPQSVLVHTCTLDHPRALGFYLKAGFIPYKLAIEIADDPRLDGIIPVTAAPQCPLLKANNKSVQ